MNRARIVLGSLGGAIAVHLSLACVANVSSSPNGGPHATGGGGVFDAMVDAVQHVMGDSSTRDAIADTDASSSDSGSNSGSCGCSGAFVEGSRLRNEYLTGADGTKQPVPGYMWDSQVQAEVYGNVDAPLSDGNHYWLPTAAAEDGNSGRLFFLDAACTKGVFYTFTPGGASPAYAWADEAVKGSAFAYARFFPMAGMISAPFGTLYTDETYASPSGACVTAQAPAAGGSWYALGPEAAPSSWVAVARTHD